MTIMKNTKSMIGTAVLLCGLATGALADSPTSHPTCIAISPEAATCVTVAIDAESLKKFLDDQPKTAALSPSKQSAKEPSA